ncbi:hypothetical protein PG994_001973 [Apiospora phragmitis]|uniref:DUF7598 domain-containing protein n=1 Tax=Apiospora phragmitis TaxID=2905665 RepID=A0ABR1WV14_9PEZI
MFNVDRSSSVKGSAYIILNVIRSLNILVLLLIAASSVILMIPAKMPDGFTFFNDVALFFILVICIFLAVSELPSFKTIGFIQAWYTRNWPAVGPHRGLKWFGLAMVILGCHTLGRLSDPRNGPSHMALPFWRLCLAGGILAITFGIVNIVTSWLFSGEGGLTARELRSNGAVTSTETYSSRKADPYDTYSEDYESHRSASVRKEKGRSFWNRGNKKPKISRPMPFQPDLEKGEEVIDDPVPSRSSPVIPGLQRPPSALHPIHGRHPSNPNHLRQPSGNRYSLASNVDQFSQI